MGGAPLHNNNLIGTAAVGVSKLVPLKMNNKALSTSLLLLARSLTNRKLVALDHRLTIRLKTPSKSIQHFVKVIITRNKQLNSFRVPTKKPRPPIVRGLPSDVTQQRRKPSEISRKQEENTGTEKDLRLAQCIASIKQSLFLLNC